MLDERPAVGRRSDGSAHGRNKPAPNCYRDSMNVVGRPRAPYGVSIDKPTCLYYPFFTMQDQEWTKKALLFWDRIATIVPKNVDLTFFPDPAFHDLVAAGALQPWAVSSEIRSEVTESAVQMIDAGVHLQFPPGEPFPINFGKMTAELQDGLTERNLVRGATPTDLLLDRKRRSHDPHVACTPTSGSNERSASDR